MTGMAAIAFCAAFTSCSKEITPMTEEEMVAIGVQKIYSDYAASFQKAFGTPAPGHTWGFSDVAGTRSVDVNGNLWETCPSLASGEAQAIHDWVNKPKSEIPTESYSEVSPVDLENFFVTQVWGQNENTNDANCKYKDYDNGNVFGSEKMNHLQISKSATRLGLDGVPSVNATWDNPGERINADWDHANNFNAAKNQDWNGNTMFVNWGTQNFAYHNSYDSRYHDKWIIVDGYYITEDHRFAGKYYVCFDFISRNPAAYTNFQDAAGFNHEVAGAYKNVADAVGQTTKDGKTVEADWKWVNAVGGNMIVDANEYYTDWIIRLVEAKPKTDLRVMAEDLTEGESDADFDFNDVVFDVHFSPNVGEAFVMVQAAGGTLPLTVHGTEVHGLWGKSTDTMINTHAEAQGLKGVSGLPAKKIQLTGIIVNSRSDVNTKVKIMVEKEIKTLDGIVKKPVELVNGFDAACKIGVAPSTPIANERTSVRSSIRGWNKWVTEGGELESTN